MLTEQQNNKISDQVYQFDSTRKNMQCLIVMILYINSINKRHI